MAHLYGTPYACPASCIILKALFFNYNNERGLCGLFFKFFTEKAAFLASLSQYNKRQTKKTKAMKTINKTDILLKALDIELKKLLQQDLQNFRTEQIRKQLVKKAA